MAEDGAAFWDKLADRYAAQPVSDQAAYEAKLEKTRTYLQSDMSVLEIGCGTGSTAIAQAPYVRHIMATDISPRMIEIARDKAAAADADNVSFEVAGVEQLQVLPGSFDVVMAHSILHLVQDLDVVLEQCRTYLRPGGLLVSSTVCLGDGMWILKPLVGLMKWLGKAPQVSFLKAHELRQKMVLMGFDLEYDWQPPGRMPVLFLIARKREANVVAGIGEGMC